MPVFVKPAPSHCPWFTRCAPRWKRLFRVLSLPWSCGPGGMVGRDFWGDPTGTASKWAVTGHTMENKSRLSSVGT